VGRRAGIDAAKLLHGAGMNRIPTRSDLTLGEFASLREIVDRSFLSRGTVPAVRRIRLVELGLIQDAMGGLMPTPAGRIVARM